MFLRNYIKKVLALSFRPEFSGSESIIIYLDADPEYSGQHDKVVLFN